MHVWIAIKNNYFTNGPKHVFQAIQTPRYLSDELLQVVDPIIVRNALFVPPENVFFDIIVNERKHVRELGYR